MNFFCRLPVSHGPGTVLFDSQGLAPPRKTSQCKFICSWCVEVPSLHFENLAAGEPFSSLGC